MAGLLEELKLAAERTCKANDAHMAREESTVLPVLQESLCAAEQRAMVWRTLRAMPLRLLERVLPWLAGTTAHTICTCYCPAFVHALQGSFLLELVCCMRCM